MNQITFQKISSDINNPSKIYNDYGGCALLLKIDSIRELDGIKCVIILGDEVLEFEVYKNSLDYLNKVLKQGGFNVEVVE